MSRQQRFTLASVAALSLHALLFVSGWLVIKQISIPSDENRVMVLTLESTPLDGLLQPEAEVSETLNHSKVNDAAGMPEQPQPSDLSQLTTLPHPRPTFELQPEVLPEPLPQQESTSHDLLEQPQLQQVISEVTPSAPHNPALDDAVANQASKTAFDSSAEILAPLPDYLLTAPAAEFSVSLKPDEVPISQPQAIPVSATQQRLIERKIQHWARKLSVTEQVDQSYSWQHKGQTYTARFTHLPAASNMQLDELMVEVKTTENGQALTTLLRLKKLAFSNFAQFVHRWDPLVMIHDDEMNGRFHSNSQILLASDRKTRPVFHGKVTTASSRVDFDKAVRGSARREIFKGGLETGVKRILMPKPKMLFSGSTEISEDDTIRFASDTRIIFTEEGGFMWHPIDEDGAPRYRVLPDRPIYLLAERGVTLSISGKVLGKIMVYSPTRIVIEDDLTYARADFSQSDDVLGIISDRDVVIAGQEMTGKGDLVINASIYARRYFTVRDFSEPHTGTLRIFGSISAGSISATQPRYATNITFDERFEQLRPPGFPVTDRYEVVEADGVWAAE